VSENAARRTADLTALAPELKQLDCQACYTVQSKYFLARGLITLDGLPLEFHSLLLRGTGPNNGGIHVLQRSRGADG
jgi:hypothetical protein